MSAGVYEAVQPGDQVCLDLYRGAFDLNHYVVRAPGAWAEEGRAQPR